MTKKCFYFLFFGVLFSSCVSKKNQIVQQNILTLRDSYCKAPSKYNYATKIPSHNYDSILVANQQLRKSFTDRSILILNALEALDEVEAIIKLKKDTSTHAKIKVLQMKNFINSKITIALTELDAVAAEFDCEGERVSQMANYVDNINSSRNNKMILYSIIAGAATSIASGIITNQGWGNAINIGGGIIGGGLGFTTLNPKGKKVEFIHQRNLLRDIWTGKLQSPNFPPFVWYMYSEEKFTNAENQSIIANMKQRWLHYHFDGDLQKANNSVIFNDGGIYRSGDLHNRAAMLNQMQSATRTINQHINYLLLDLDRFVFNI